MTLRLMVIDDETSTENLYNRLFRDEIRLGNITITFANNGTEGISLLNNMPHGSLPDLVILDLNMPGPNGLEVGAFIRDLNTSIALIVLTAYGDEHNRRKAFALGVNQFLEKPTNIYDLKKVILQYAS